MTKFEENVEEVIVVSKEGIRTVFPSIWYAKERATGFWKGEVDRIEVTTVIKVTEED
jgi:hypothetical protein